jgi:3-dehydroquinate synthase
VLRGVPFVQVPTTLLAMVDSSVGGKTGVNSPRGKNLVGVFYPPKLVYAAMSVLDTLPEAEWRCGLGEAVKTALVGDAEFVGWMEAHAAEIRARAPGICLALVSRCCAIKAAVVSKDEREEGLRAILNFGHTVGHAIETAMGHGTMRHGEAVALGLLAEARGWVEEPGYCARLALLLAALGLPRGLEEVEGARGLGSTDGSSLETRLLDAARLDKKRARGSISLVVPLRVGRVRLEKVPAENLAELLTFVPPAMEPT